MKKISVLFVLAFLLFLVLAAEIMAAELEDKLREAAQKGDVAAVKTLLDMGANVNARSGSYGETALMGAIEYIDVVRVLLDRGADVNAKSNSGNTALMSAVYGNADVVQLLVDRGADVNAEGGLFSGTVLMTASASSKPAIVQILVNNGADVNAKGDSGNTALMAAAWRGKIDNARMLIKNGADVNAKTKDGYTALTSSAFWGYADIVQLLIESGANVNTMDSDGKTALMEATEIFEKGKWGPCCGEDGKMPRVPLSPEEKERYRKTVRLLKEAAARSNIPSSDKQQFNPGIRAPETAKYECPKTGYINCMPLLKESDKDKCSEDYLEWVKSHCPGAQVVY